MEELISLECKCLFIAMGGKTTEDYSELNLNQDFAFHPISIPTMDRLSVPCCIKGNIECGLWGWPLEMESLKQKNVHSEIEDVNSLSV